MIEISHLTKRCGELLAVSDLSFTADSGPIYGFLEPSGASAACRSSLFFAFSSPRHLVFMSAGDETDMCFVIKTAP